MFPLFGPILAQVVTVGVADRTEVRYIESGDKYAEASTSPRANLNALWRHTGLNLSYGSSLTLTPLASDSRQLLVFHAASLGGAYHWGRTAVTLSEGVSYGRLNFQTQALADPNLLGVTNATGANAPGAGPTGTVTAPPPAQIGSLLPGTGPATSTSGGSQNTPATQTRAVNQIVSYASSSTDLNVSNAVSPVVTLQGGVGYLVAGSVDRAGSSTAQAYPVVKGPHAIASAGYRFGPHDTATTSLSAQYASTTGTPGTLVVAASEGWGHNISRRSSMSVNVGSSGSRQARTDGLVAYSIYPTLGAALVYSDFLARGTISLSCTVSAAPVLDTVRATVDPRVSLGSAVAWSKEHFSTSLSGGTTLSLAQEGSSGALSSLSASYSVSYAFATAVSSNAGVRVFWQSFEGNTTPLAYAGFVGLTLALSAPLNH
jgi:hypothetical protein